MKVSGVVAVAFSLVAIAWGVGLGCAGVSADYEFDRTILADWSLADRSSTIKDKAAHMDAFVAALDKSGLAGSHDAIIYPTPQNAFDTNFVALKTLQTRLHEIEGMDVKSFEYQTAIQQITAQEIGEARSMIHTFYGCWLKERHLLLWGWVHALQVVGIIIVALIAGVAALVWVDAH